MSTCKWCGGPIPESTYKLSAPRVYCSRECDIARRMKRDYYAEEVEHMLSMGSSPAQAAEQLGLHPASLARALYREGRDDLARPVQNVAAYHRQGKCEHCGANTSKPGRTRCRPCGNALKARRAVA